MDKKEKLELQLDSFNAAERKEALLALWQMVQSGEIKLPSSTTDVNLHLHTFYSYNACGYSPSKIAWKARNRGLAVTGIVDFDVFDGLEEFLVAAKLIGLKGSVGMETRVYVPEFADKEITSPGEPGITYHMGVGFAESVVPDAFINFKSNLKETVQNRNRDLITRVNEYLSPVELNFEKDVCPLTPSGNATERHICLAYAKKARSIFTDDKALANYWHEKIGITIDDPAQLEGANLQGTIRSKTMKRGGVGYVQAGEGSFPTMSDTNKFILGAGGIPTFTWLNGLSDGEKEIEKLLEIAMSTGVAAINIIPDRNFTAGVKDEKLANLQHVVKLAVSLDLPIIVGTEMNSPGLKFVDDLDSDELSPMAPIFLKGCHIVYAHSVMQKQLDLGYLSDWAKDNFATTASKNDFYEKVGKLLDPAKEDSLSELKKPKITPKQIIEKL
ncbi:MAG: hypothetical protein FVQ82_13175 [Planctomycetes bacterium]|nr:hypothetical protein [Planctomycetota bacterium]